ncbi:MAG: hypothetical protein ACE5J6_01565, partial [Candidatus Bathyarchaeia archaeon]
RCRRLPKVGITQPAKRTTQKPDCRRFKSCPPDQPNYEKHTEFAELKPFENLSRNRDDRNCDEEC